MRKDIIVFWILFVIIILASIVVYSKLYYNIIVDIVSSRADKFDESYPEYLAENITSSCRDHYWVCRRYADDEPDYDIRVFMLGNCDMDENECEFEKIKDYTEDNFVKRYEDKGYAVNRTGYDDIVRRAGNCQSWSMLAAAMLKTKGFETYYIVQERHMCVMAKVNSEYKEIICNSSPFLMIRKVNNHEGY